MTIGISEILEKVSKEKNRDKKIELLRSYMSVPLLDIFRLVYDTYEWDIPFKLYKYRPYEGFDAHGALYFQMKKIPRYFLKGTAPELSQERKEILWMQMLESVDPADAKLMQSVLNKKIPYTGFNKKLIEDAFPGVFNAESEEARESF